MNKKDAVFTDFDEGVTELSVSKSGDGTTDHPPQYTLERRLKVSVILVSPLLIWSLSLMLSSCLFCANLPVIMCSVW